VMTKVHLLQRTMSKEHNTKPATVFPCNDDIFDYELKEIEEDCSESNSVNNGLSTITHSTPQKTNEEQIKPSQKLSQSRSPSTQCQSSHPKTCSIDKHSVQDKENSDSNLEPPKKEQTKSNTIAQDVPTISSSNTQNNTLPSILKKSPMKSSPKKKVSWDGAIKEQIFDSEKNPNRVFPQIKKKIQNFPAIEEEPLPSTPPQSQEPPIPSPTKDKSTTQLLAEKFSQRLASMQHKPPVGSENLSNNSQKDTASSQRSCDEIQAKTAPPPSDPPIQQSKPGTKQSSLLEFFNSKSGLKRKCENSTISRSKDKKQKVDHV